MPTMLPLVLPGTITVHQPQYKMRQDKSFALVSLILAFKWQSSSKLSVEI